MGESAGFSSSGIPITLRDSKGNKDEKCLGAKKVVNKKPDFNTFNWSQCVIGHSSRRVVRSSILSRPGKRQDISHDLLFKQFQSCMYMKINDA